MYLKTRVLDVRQTSQSIDSTNNRPHHFDNQKYWLDIVFSAVLGHRHESYVNLSWSNVNLVIFTYCAQMYTNVDLSKRSVEVEGKSSVNTLRWISVTAQ